MDLKKKAVAMLSGGVDSHLAIRLMQIQGIEVEALNFKSIFNCCKDDAAAVARRLGVKLTLVPLGEDYLELIRKPKFGWGRSVNPCMDCRIYMFKIAKRFMNLVGASFIVTGEVLGQRPKSQMRDALTVIPKEAGLADLILRPLSAKLLVPTLPEREGIVDRERLYDIEGRSRRRLHELARQLGIAQPPDPSIGCILTDTNYGNRVKDHLAHCSTQFFWDFEAMKVGRHYRLDDKRKVILGRNQGENDRLANLHGNGQKTTLFEPENFPGPSALLIGDFEERLVPRIGNLILQSSKRAQADKASVAYRNSQTQGKFLTCAGGENIGKI